MAHHLNTNKQFMIGNGILAFAVIFVVVIFVYMSMRLQRQKEGERHFAETYNITLVKGFAGDSISILLNDSVLADRRIGEEPFNIEVKTVCRAKRTDDSGQGNRQTFSALS